MHIRKDHIEPLRQALEQRAARAEEEYGKLRSALDGKQKQIDELKSMLSQQAALVRRIGGLEAGLSEQQRIADIEARLAARQKELQDELQAKLPQQSALERRIGDLEARLSQQAALERRIGSLEARLNASAPWSS